MGWLNTIAIPMLSLLPKWMVRPFASPYVAGETVNEVIQIIKEQNIKGFDVTVDILGEHVYSPEEANQIQIAYGQLYDRIAEEKVRANISLKLTHLGLELDPYIAEKHIFLLLKKAESYQNFLRIDMEDSPYTDATMKIYKKCISKYLNVGMVLQAYLHRSIHDIKALNNPDFNVRICKGIYNESPSISYKNRDEINKSFIQCVQSIIQGEGYAAIATHDIFLIDTLEEWLLSNKISKKRFEFQVLYGVPMGNRLYQLMEKGIRVRVYIPFGKAWFEYSIRRLKENPNILGYVLKNLFKKRL